MIALAEDGNELTAVRALQLGAVDYLPKRLLTPERLRTAVRVALRRVERRVARRLASLANLSREQALKAQAEAAVAAAFGEAPVDSAGTPAYPEAAAAPPAAAAIRPRPQRPRRCNRPVLPPCWPPPTPR